MSELKILSWAELSELSDKELLDLLDKYNAAAIIQKNIEQAIKILINSLYGYLGSIYSRFYNRYLAEGITLNGQTHIRDSERAINNYLEKITGTKKDRVIACDTDSVIFSTIITVNGKKITIGEYYDRCDSTLINDGKETKYINTNDLAVSYDGKEVVENRIVYAMRHKVKKKLYRIIVDGISVTVTEDHSVMVIDLDGNLIKIKPIDMNPKIHKVIKIIEKYRVELTNNFTVECLGESEEYVYDIEVENTHNFFANDILVHNSNYINLTDIVYHPKLRWNEKPPQEIVDLLIKFCDDKLKVAIDLSFNQLFDDMNGYKQTIDMKREAIGAGTFCGKKRYTMYVFDNENKRYDEPQLKIIGLEAVRSTTPKYFRDMMKIVYKMMYTHDEADVHQKVKEVYEEYMKLPLSAIGEPKGVKLEKYANTNILGSFVKGAPGHVKAAFTYNNMIREMKLTREHQLITEGSKIKLYRLKSPNIFKNNLVAILDKIPPEFELEKFVDRDAMFEKTFIESIDRLLAAKNWCSKKKLNLNDIFGF